MSPIGTTRTFRNVRYSVAVRCKDGVIDEIELGRLHDRQVARLFALENPSGVNTYLVMQIKNTGAVTHQSADRCNSRRS